MNRLSRRCAIVGAHEHRLRKAPETNELLFAFEAAKGALEDAGLEPSDIDGLFTPPMNLEGGPLGPGAALLLSDYLGIRPRFIDETDVGGASFGYYVNRAAMAIDAGLMSCALIVYAARPRSGKRGIGAASTGLRATPDSFEQIYGLPLVGFYGMLAARYMHVSGLSREQLAQVPVTMRSHAALNPDALYRDPITVDDVLASAEVASPLHLLDCCVISDGAAAIVVANDEIARRVSKPPAWVLGFGEATMSHGHGHGDWVEDTVSMIGEAARGAFDMAGAGRGDIDAAMVYDAFSVNVPMALEGAGFATRGSVGEMIGGGGIGVDGQLPVNTDGGGLSSNHPGRRGLFMLVEAVRQLRGEGPGASVDGATTVATIATGAASLARRASAVHILGVE
jgi:acetyl-CoA C-acetyltransferase